MMMTSARKPTTRPMVGPILDESRKIDIVPELSPVVSEFVVSTNMRKLLFLSENLHRVGKGLIKTGTIFQLRTMESRVVLLGKNNDQLIDFSRN